MSQEGPFVDAVKKSDIRTIAAMMRADMAELGHAPSEEAMQGMCEEALARSKKEGGEIFLAARAKARGPAIGVLLANERLSVRFGGRVLWVEELYVSPDARMGGVGRALVVRALQMARARGLHGVDLEAYRMNTGASILYRSIGFERLPRERYALALDDLDWDS